MKTILQIGFLTVAALFMVVPNAYAVQVSYNLTEESGRGNITLGESDPTAINDFVSANIGDYQFSGSVSPNRVGLIGVRSGFRAVVSRFVPGFTPAPVFEPIDPVPYVDDSDPGTGGFDFEPTTEWTNIRIDTSAAGRFQTLAEVNGLSATNSVGHVRFDWVVTGISNLFLDAGDGPPLGSVTVNNATTTARLGVFDDSVVLPSTFLHDPTPGVNGAISDVDVANLRVDSFLVPYDFSQLEPGETPVIPVDFEFAVETSLNITNSDDLGNFEALFDANFLNTATLSAVTFVDDNLGVLDGVGLIDPGTGQSIVVSSVPEPATAIVLLLAGCAGSIRRRRRAS